MMRSRSFFIQMLIACLFILVIGLAFYYQVTDRFPFPFKVNAFLGLFTHILVLTLLIIIFAFYLAAIIYGKHLSKVLFRDIHKKATHVKLLQEKSLSELREGWTTFIQLAATSDEGEPPDWKVCLYEIKRVLDDILIQIQRDKVSPNLTLMSHIQVQIKYLEKQIGAWMAHETRNSPIKRALEPLPEEVNKALTYLDELLAEKTVQENEETRTQPLPPRRERKKNRKSNGADPTKEKKVKEEVPKVPLPPRKIIHVPWWRKFKRGKNK